MRWETRGNDVDGEKVSCTNFVDDNVLLKEDSEPRGLEDFNDAYRRGACPGYQLDQVRGIYAVGRRNFRK